MPQELIHINVRNIAVRIVLILLLMCAGTVSYFATRWYIGNTLAEYFNSAQNNLDTAHMAVSMAPSDPLTHWRVAQVTERVMPLDQQSQAVTEYEKAANLSPNDYRLWVSLGRAYEQAGDPVKAETALKRAVALAPSYAYPHWYLGNLLLRIGRYEEAFSEIRIASDAEPELRGQQFNLIWAIYSNDTEGLIKSLGQRPDAKASFSLYLLNQKRFEEGLRLWNSISTEEKRANRGVAALMVTVLKNDLRFHDAVKVWNDVASDRYRAEVGQIFDGSFEHMAGSGEHVFAWQVQGAPHMQVGVDQNSSSSGTRSLRMRFQARTNLDDFAVSQLIAVQPNTEYELAFDLSTGKLETGSEPLIQIFDASNAANLLTTPQAPNGTHAWNRFTYTFKTGDKTEGILLRIVRISCRTEETPVCPIFGSVWYDDFSLKRRN